MVSPTGHKSFKYRYRFQGKPQTLNLGVYPDMSLAEARMAHEAARKQLSRGLDPRMGRRTSKFGAADGCTFEQIAWEWFNQELSTVDRLGRPKWSEGHAKRIKSVIEKDLCPRLGRMMPDDIGPIDITPAIKGALKSRMPRRFAAITDDKTLSEMLEKIDSYEGGHVIRCALKLVPLIFVRPGEIAAIKWEYVNFKRREIRIPEYRLKRKDRPADHIVPLADQSLVILKKIQPYTGHSAFVFPLKSDPEKHMRRDDLRSAIRKMGFTEEQVTTHGFRRTATTMLTEQGWDRDIIRRQLAHIDPNAMHAIYDSAERLADRRRLMQFWADYLDELRKPALLAQSRP